MTAQISNFIEMVNGNVIHKLSHFCVCVCAVFFFVGLFVALLFEGKTNGKNVIFIHSYTVNAILPGPRIVLYNTILCVLTVGEWKNIQTKRTK